MSIIKSMMDNNSTNKKITGECCGRPFPKAKPCGCNYYDGCLTEYPGTMLGCVKKGVDPCKAKAVIPAITTETVDGITNLANCFAHVTNINTTFYIDDKHRPMITWAGPVEAEDYDIETNELELRSQFCFTTIDGVFTTVYYDKRGEAHVIGMEA